MRTSAGRPVTRLAVASGVLVLAGVGVADTVGRRSAALAGPSAAAAAPDTVRPLGGLATPSASRPVVDPTSGALASVEAVVADASVAGLRVAVAVQDTETGRTWSAGDALGGFPSESTVKVVIAARVAADGPLSAADEDDLTAMLTTSDDDAANRLWGVVGGPEVVTWAETRYGIEIGTASDDWGWWGNTTVTATGLSGLMSAVAADPAVAPWLLPRLAATAPTAADGTSQAFGLGAVPGVLGVVPLKQGWGGDDDDLDSTNLLSTAVLGDGRFAATVVVQHDDVVGSSVVTGVSDRLAATTADLVDAAATDPT